MKPPCLIEPEKDLKRPALKPYAGVVDLPSSSKNSQNRKM